MRCSAECVPCFVKQALGAARLVTDDEELHLQITSEVFALAGGVDLTHPPPAIAQQIHRLVRKMTGVDDLYYEVKQQFNRFALDLMPQVRKRIEQADHPDDTALRYAIAGNCIDFGIGGKSLTEEEVLVAIDEAMELPLYGSAEGFWHAVNLAKRILYLADNAGEIVFDRLLIERMPIECITLAVRGGPILNDVLIEDAQMVGLTELVNVIDNGSDAPGTILDDCSPQFIEAFDAADLVISKGQGNYETLSDHPKHIYFILKAKCNMVAHNLARDIGDHVVMMSHHGTTCG